MPIRSVTLRILGDDKSARAALDWVSAKADEIERLDPTVHVGADTAAAEGPLATLRANLAELADRLHQFEIRADDEQAQAALIGLGLKYKALQSYVDTHPLIPEMKLARIDMQILRMGAELNALLERTRKVDFVIDQEGLTRLQAQLEAFGAQLHDTKVGIDDRSAQAKLLALSSQYSALRKQMEEPISPDLDLARVEAQILTMEASLERVGGSGGGGGAGAASALLGNLPMGQVALWGGATAVSGLHLLIDSLVEVAAIAIPATTALLVYGGALVALAPDADLVYQREKNMYTATDILGQKMPGLSGSLNTLNANLKPQVFSVWGDALDIVNGKAGIFGGVVAQSAKWVQQFAANIVVDLKNGTGAFSQVLSAGRRDLGALGHIFLELGSALLGFFKVSETTHIAQFLLDIAGAGARLLDAITKLPTPLLATAVGLHGLYLWGGLIAQPFTTAGRAVAGLLQNFGFIKSPAKDVSLAMDDMGFAAEGVAGKTGLATGAANLFKGGLGALAAVPVWGWVGLGVAALGGLVTWLVLSDRHTNALTQQINGLNTAIGNTSNDTAFNKLASDYALINKEFIEYGKNAAAAEKSPLAGISLQQVNVINEAASGYKALGAEQQKLYGQMNNFGQGVTWIMSTFKVGYPEALAIADQAGVKLTNSILGNSKAAQVARQQIIGLVTGFEQLQTPAGMAGKDFEALAYASNDITQKIGQLNSAWSGWMKVVTGGQTSFDTFAQGLATLSSDSGTFTWHLGNLTVKGQQSKAAIDQLSASGINLNQAFMSEVGNANNVIAALRSQNASSGELTLTTKAAVAALIPWAKGSQEATSVLYGLAQQANYTGNDSIASLTQWAGIKAPNALKIMKQEEDKATTGASDLAKTIQNLLNASFQQDLIQSTGASKALQKYTQDLQNNKLTIAQGKNDRQQLISDLEKSGMNAKQATAFVDGLSRSIGLIPKSTALRLLMTGTGSYVINANNHPGVPSNISNAQAAGFAAGGMVHGGTPGRDSVLIMAQQGEAVVPTHVVPHVAPILKAHGVPGFASGGIVGDISPGQFSAWPGNVYNTFQGQFTAAMVSTMQAALKQAESMFASGSLGAYSAAAAVAQAFAKSLLPSFGWGISQFPYLVELWNKESGWNAAARNPTSGAAGIPQDISGNFHGGYQGQVIWGENYIKGRYGSPEAAWAHEVAYNWYDQGGFLPTGLSLAYNGTGFPEPVTPLKSAGGAGGNTTINLNVYAHPSNNPDEVARQVWQQLRTLKTHMGNRSLGLD